MIERFFDDNKVVYEEIPQNDILNSWALRLKSKTIFGSLYFDRSKSGFIKASVGAIIAGIFFGLIFALNIEKHTSLTMLGLVVCILSVLLGLISGIFAVREFISDAKVKYENRRFYSVVNSGDDKIKSKFDEYFEDIEIYVSGFERRVNKDKLVFIVLQGETIEKTAILIVTEEALLTRPKATISFRPMFLEKMYGGVHGSKSTVGCDSRNFF